MTIIIAFFQKKKILWYGTMALQLDQVNEKSVYPGICLSYIAFGPVVKLTVTVRIYLHYGLTYVQFQQ